MKIEIPEKCPSCGSQVEQINSQLFCRNTSCSAQSTKKVEAFIKKMRIKGLGPANISKLGFVQPIEIYETSLENYIIILGEKIGQKIFEEIQNSRNTTFSTFLSALSIPLIGDTASKKIVTNNKVNNIKNILNNDYIDSIGPKAEHNLYTYLEDNIDVLALEEYFNFIETKTTIKESKGTVCITGKLDNFKNRTKAKEFLEDQGYTVTSTITSKTTVLIDEEGRVSSKSKKAESLGIPILTIINLIKG